MKWRYAISYGNMKPGDTGEKLEKDVAKYKAELENVGIKMLFWGHPFGVSENVVWVLDLEGSMDKYIKTMDITSPITGQRTDFVLER